MVARRDRGPHGVSVIAKFIAVIPFSTRTDLISPPGF
jgi:hypothetical protein